MGAEQVEQEFETIVVTATKTPKKVEDVPAVITVIEKEELEAIPARTVFDLIADLPGVSFNEPQGEGLVTPQLLTIRGQGFTGSTLILLDGQRIDSPFTYYSYLTTIPVRAIERIEVIRGPFSALYGSNAGGGIINIITRDGGKNSFVSPWLETGSYGRMDYGVDGGIVWKNISIGMFYDHKELDNYYLYNDFGLDTRNRDYSHKRFHGKLTGTIGDNTSFSLSGGIINATTGFGISRNLALENYQDANHPYVNFQISSKIMNNLEVRGQLDWLHAGHDYYGETLENVTWRTLPSGQRIPIFDYKPSVNITDADRYRANLYATYYIAENHIITAGTELTYTEAEKGIYELSTGRILNVQGRQGTKADVDDTSYSFYAQYDWMILKNLELILGARFDHYETYGSEFSPKATLRWDYMKDGNIKLSVGKGFRSPNLNELYSPPWTMVSFIVYQGNPDLKAETTWSYEVSIEQYFFDRKVSARVTPYYTKGDDFINPVRRPDPLNPGGQIMQPENIDEVTIKGVDLELAYYLTPKTKLFFNYNYNETRDDKTDEILDGYAKNSLAMGVRAIQPLWEDLKLFGSYSARYRGSYKSTSWGMPPVTETVGDYWYHTVGLTLDWKDIVKLSLDVYNIFNEREKRSIDGYIPERNYIIGVSFKYAF